MLFNSLTFLIFLGCFLLLWRWAKEYTRWRLLLILVASVVFYGWWDWRFLFLIFFTGSIDFLLALLLGVCRKIQNAKKQQIISKILVSLSIISGLGVLCIFKYSVFFAQLLNDIAGIFGINFDLTKHIPEFCLILPIGISFYTFQSLSYTIDVYRKKIEPTKSFIHYMAYLMLFPQLVAGPIVRAVDLLPKLLQKPQTSSMVQYNALKLIVLGFFKKCVIADNAATVVDTAFSHVNIYQGSWTWFLVMVMFSIQIYCDFSGYSDIARGIIKYMGYRFNLNFNHPYIACGLQDFWSRWHISLSSWFRDYVYIPLGGNRKGKFRTLFNLFFTFLISGLWHGAALNFITWGAFHGIIQIIEKLIKLPEFLKKHNSWYVIAANTVLTQLLVLTGWVFFRAASFTDAKNIIGRMVNFSAEVICFKPNSNPYVIFVVFLIMEFFLIKKFDCKLLRKYTFYRHLEPILVGVLIVITIFYRGEEHGFIYFQF